MKKRPRGFVVLAMLAVVEGVMAVTAVPAVLGVDIAPTDNPILVIWYVAFALSCFAAGYALWRVNRWVRRTVATWLVFNATASAAIVTILRLPALWLGALIVTLISLVVAGLIAAYVWSNTKPG